MTDTVQDNDPGKIINDAAQAAAERASELRQAFEERASAAREWAADQTDVLRDTVQTQALHRHRRLRGFGVRGGPCAGRAAHPTLIGGRQFDDGFCLARRARIRSMAC